MEIDFLNPTITLDQPLSWCGETYTQIDIDFTRLKGKDLRAIEAELRRSQRVVIYYAGNTEFLLRLAVRASGVPLDALRALDMTDFARVREYIQLRLLTLDNGPHVEKTDVRRFVWTGTELVLDQDGKAWGEIAFDLSGVTGRTIAAIETELNQNRAHTVVSYGDDGDFLHLLLASAGHVPEDVLDQLPLLDYFHLRRLASDFFPR